MIKKIIVFAIAITLSSAVFNGYNPEICFDEDGNEVECVKVKPTNECTMPGCF